MIDNRQVLITGGGTFLGDNIAAALLAEGASVTLLVRPGAEDKLGLLAQRVRWQTADTWDSASLRGRARGHGTVIHTVGSMIADPSLGLTHHRMNFMSARNVVTMCVNDGVPHMILMSSANAFWMSGSYIRAKREAEAYLKRIGVRGTIIRAPLTYVRGQRRPLFYEFISLLGKIPPLSWSLLGRVAPMPVDVLARGVARIALGTEQPKSTFYARDLWQLNTKAERSTRAAPMLQSPVDTSIAKSDNYLFGVLDEEAPFGWQPPEK